MVDDDGAQAQFPRFPRFPRGSRVPGRVRPLPWPAGQTGLFVDLGREQAGFVDVVHLPDDPDRWPTTGREGLFEVLHYQRGQIRLFPLDAEMRSETYRVSVWSEDEWRAIADRHPVGSTIAGTVISIWDAEREYDVDFGDFRSVVDYDGEPPAFGAVETFVVAGHSESTRRILIEPAR
jgi:hypothetical protein